MKKQQYTVGFQSGVNQTIAAATLDGAKHLVTKALVFGAGNATLFDNEGNPLVYREFWSARNRFGWRPWKVVGAEK